MLSQKLSVKTLIESIKSNFLVEIALKVEKVGSCAKENLYFSASMTTKVIWIKLSLKDH